MNEDLNFLKIKLPNEIIDIIDSYLFDVNEWSDFEDDLWPYY